MVTDPIADLLTRIRNAQRAGQKYTRVPVSKVADGLLKVLLSEGFISGYEKKAALAGKKFEEFNVGLKYYPDGEPCIRVAQRVSRPGRRIYWSINDVPKVFSGLGSVILSTSKGILGDREARKLNIGGEVLAKIG